MFSKNKEHLKQREWFVVIMLISLILCMAAIAQKKRKTISNQVNKVLKNQSHPSSLISRGCREIVEYLEPKQPRS